MNNKRSNALRQRLIKVTNNTHTRSHTHIRRSFCKRGINTPITSLGGISVLLPDPVLHKVILSWPPNKNLNGEFKKKFGPRKGNTYRNGLFLKKATDSPWWSIIFNAENELLRCLSELQSEISSGYGDVQLKQIETAWNVPVASYAIGKRILLNLAHNTLLMGEHVRLWLEPPDGGTILVNADGTKNGEVTAYFNKRRRSKGEYVPVKNSEWNAKMYLKEISGIWHLHIEITLEKRFLIDKNIPMGIPESVSPDWLKALRLQDFLKFASFDLQKVIELVRKLLRGRQNHNRKTKYTQKQLHRLRLALGELQNAIDLPSCDQKFVAYKVAGMFKSERLKQRIRNEEFDLPYNPFAE